MLIKDTEPIERQLTEYWNLYYKLTKTTPKVIKVGQDIYDTFLAQTSHNVGKLLDADPADITKLPSSTMVLDTNLRPREFYLS